MLEKLRNILRSKKHMNSVAILGANSLLGQHVFNTLFGHVQSISVWTYSGSFLNRLEVLQDVLDNQNNPTVGVRYFLGMEELSAAIAGCDTVLNLHEFQDFSIMPDKAMLYEHNVEFVKKLLEACVEEKVENLVHLSSIYLQCSSWWPNVGSREEDPGRFVHENPFPDYFNSKYEAEKLISECNYIKCIVARVGPLYGEGDRCSMICDVIKLNRHFGLIPIVGDLDGAIQVTYAGNASDALIKCAEKTKSFESGQQETVNICDSTSVGPFFNGVVSDCFEANGVSVSNWHIPFWLFFPLYWILCMLGRLLNFIPYVENPLRSLPSASYVYFALRQWTFLSNYRLRLFADFVPKYDEDETLSRSLRYYEKQLQPDDVCSFSWRNIDGL